MMAWRPHTLLQLLEPNDFPRLDTIFADHKYHNHALHAWMAEHRPRWHIEVKTRPEGAQRLHAPGETLGGGADERLAWSLSAP